eukprot:scaffold53.g4537.t1
MRELREYPDVSILIYDQTCAAEKRRRRKRNAYPDPARRVVINERVCEGCGDCSKQSHCLSVEPLETEFGRKRTINQSSCNKDFSCLKGFCPSFVTVEGGKLRKPKAPVQQGRIDEGLTLPPASTLDSAYGVFIAGMGGTGVVTIGQLLGMAAHIEGKGCSVLDMAGLAQKGGAVYSHVLLAPTADDLLNTRVAMGEAHLILVGDLVVGTSQEAMARIRRDRTHILVNSDVAPTAAFVNNPNWRLPLADLQSELQAAAGPGNVETIDAAELAVGLLGDAIYANALMLGYTYQKGWLPLGQAALERAIELNGQQVANNLAAFAWGRRAAANLPEVQALIGSASVVEMKRPAASELAALVSVRTAFLTQYQNARYAAQYKALIDKVAQAERTLTGTTRLATVVARYYFKLMAYKDEYEVARLYTDGEFLNKIHEQFEGDWKLKFYLAPPLLAKRDAQGHLIKRAFGPSVLKAFAVLARLRFLRAIWTLPWRWRAYPKRYADTAISKKQAWPKQRSSEQRYCSSLAPPSSR